MTLACCRQIYSSFPVIRPGGLRAARISFTSTFGVARHVVPSASSVIRVTNTGQPTAVRSSGPVVTSSLINQPSAISQSINQSASIQSAISNQSSISHQSLLAWAAFRRGGQLADEQLEPFHLCPVTSRAMQRAEQDPTFVGSVGSTLYYWWNLPGSLDFRASAHASR